jgi:hypothetical protein
MAIDTFSEPLQTYVAIYLNGETRVVRALNWQQAFNNLYKYNMISITIA